MFSRSLLRQYSAFRVGGAPLLRVAPSARLWPAASSLQPRHYTAAAEPSKTAAAPSSSEGGAAASDKSPADSAEKSPEEAAKAQLEAKDVEIRELKDSYLRSVADFRNLQERTKREVSQARDFAITRFAKDLIDSVDNLDRALAAVPQAALGAESGNKDLKDLHGGLKMTESILMQTLAKHGLVRFDPSENGEKFDPNVHEATFMTKMDGKEDGTVFNTVQKGYMLNGRVVRAAKVGVVKNS